MEEKAKPKTFMQAVYEGALQAANSPENKAKLQGFNHPDFELVMRTMTEALDTLPPTINMHVVLMATTFIQNAFLMAYKDTQERLAATSVGGNA